MARLLIHISGRSLASQSILRRRAGTREGEFVALYVRRFFGWVPVGPWDQGDGDVPHKEVYARELMDAITHVKCRGGGEGPDFP